MNAKTTNGNTRTATETARLAADWRAKLAAAADRVAARAAVEDAARRMGAVFTDIGIDITTGDLERLTLDRRELDVAITAYWDATWQAATDAVLADWSTYVSDRAREDACRAETA